MWWYEDDIIALEQKLASRSKEACTPFYGSSSFRLWNDLEPNFSMYRAVNLGFGGSTLAACVWFFDRIFKNIEAERLVVYAGDNDLGDGRNPEEVFLFYQQLLEKIRTRYNNIPVFYLSIKPSVSRRNILSQIRYTNDLIRKDIASRSFVHYIDVFTPMLKDGEVNSSYFADDGLHLNEKGYTLWKSVITANIEATSNQAS